MSRWDHKDANNSILFTMYYQMHKDKLKEMPQ